MGKAIGDLGLRYRPSAKADLQAHAAALELLCQDVADVPVYLLDKAAKRWVRENRFMPRASELIALAQEIASAERSGTEHGIRALHEHCDRLNQMEWCRNQWQVIKTSDGHFTIDRVTSGARA